jgi:hypothetical protein
MNLSTNAQNLLGVTAPRLKHQLFYSVFILPFYLCIASLGFAQAAPATPWFSPGSGTYSYSGGISVTISDSTSGASIYYTTDGTTPTTNSTLYSGPIAVPAAPATKTFKAIAVLNGVSSYSVASATYTITPPAPTPTYSPAPATYIGGQTVSISSSLSGAVIRYTTDGSTPTASSPVYNGPFTVSQTVNILAYVSSAPGYSAGSASRGHYTIAVPTPTVTPNSGTFTTAPTITMKDSLAGASIYYTLDGSTPSSWSTLYTGPFPLTATTLGAKTIQAIALYNGMQNSAVATSSLTLSLPKGVIATALVAPNSSDTITTNFLGFSHDWKYAASMMGTASAGSNPLYPTLIKNLTDNMNGPLVVRVGANGTDTSGTASVSTVQPFIEVTQKANVQWILGVNLGSSNVSLAQQQASVFAANIPSANLMGLEIGNEPDGYSTNGLRSSSYDYSSFLPEYQQWQQAIAGATGGKSPIAGPTLGTGNWNANANTSVTTGTMKADLLTQHEYLVCYDSNNPQASDYLLQPSSAQMHLFSLVPYVSGVESTNIPFRVAEMNSLCSGGQPGLSNSFSSALWGIDAMFEYANIGVDGVNWMTGYLGGPYDLFQFSLWTRSNGMNAFTLASVRPLYYGLLLFSRAAGNTAQLYPSYTVTGSNVKIWITTDSLGKAHLVLINKDKTATGNIQVTLPGYSRGTVTRLAASGGYTATNGVTFGGQTFDNSTDGTIGGTLATESVTPSNNVWTVSIQPTSAVLVDLQP